MPSGRKPGPNSKGPRPSRNLSPEGRSEAQLRNSRPRQVEFLKALRKTLQVKSACKQAGIGRRTFYQWLAVDPKFKKKLESFIKALVTEVELTGLDLAINGSDKKTMRYAELIKFFLRSHKPSLYGLKMGLNIDLNQAVQIVLPHNGRDEKNIAKAKEPCGAKIAKAAKS